jgi:ribosomal protein S18 acetylase RimI-like enzyme
MFKYLEIAVKIIRAQKTHLNLIAPLFDAYRVFYNQPSDLIRAENFIKQRLQNSDSIIFLVTNEAESEAIGFVQIYPSFTSIGTSKIYILNDLYIKPEHRKNGVARQLLQFVQQFAKEEGVVKVVLQTAISNTIAQKLYKSLGYRKEEEFLTYTLKI